MPFLQIDTETRMYYSVRGSGIPIVFIHPPVLTSANFDYQTSFLSQYFQTITFDIRGHGKSEFSNTSITYQLIVSDIKKLLDHLEIEKAFICGYSTGGSITLEFLLTFPNRAYGGIIISGMPNVNDDYLRKKIRIGINLAKVRAKFILAWSISMGNSNTAAIFKKMFAEARQGDIRNMEQYFHCSLQYNCTQQLEKIEHPILLVYGKKDLSFHQYAMVLQERLPHNQLLLIDENHRIPTKAAKELNESIMQFVHTISIS